MVRLVLFAVAAYILWRLLWKAAQAMFIGMGYQPPGVKDQSVGLVRDPMCGTFVSPATALTSGSGSDRRYFCSEKCRQDWPQKTTRATEETQKKHRGYGSS